MSGPDLSRAIEIVPGRLYYAPLRVLPKDRSDAHFFCIDDELVYWNFFLDFGPLNLGQLYRYCQIMSNKLHDKALASKRIYHVCGTHAHHRTNSAFLISAYSMLYLGKTPEDAFRPFLDVYPPFPPFHDASPCVCTYDLTIPDVLSGINHARSRRYFDFNKFDIEEYEYFEKVEYGDLNWLAEGKFLAFAGPHDVRTSTPEGYHTLCPDDYIPYFKKKNVTLVIRLNKKYYDERRFTRAGIDHLDLYYLDGSNPPDHILKRFIEACEKTSGAIAVHCKAGLGRTGTCIGAYMMKHHRFTAAQLIGWIRTCRPGSIIGPQQHYMKSIEARMWRAGEAYEARRKGGKSAVTESKSPGVDGVSRSMADMKISGSSAGRRGVSGGGGGGGSVSRTSGSPSRSSGSGSRSSGTPIRGTASPSRSRTTGLRSPGVDSRSPGSPGGRSVGSTSSQGDHLRAARTKARSSPLAGTPPRRSTRLGASGGTTRSKR